MATEFRYMVCNETENPRLIRFGNKNAEMFAFPGKWEEVPHLNAIRYGGGAFMDYDDISEKEAAEYMKKIKERYDKIAEKG